MWKGNLCTKVCIVAIACLNLIACEKPPETNNSSFVTQDGIKVTGSESISLTSRSSGAWSPPSIITTLSGFQPSGNYYSPIRFIGDDRGGYSILYYFMGGIMDGPSSYAQFDPVSNQWDLGSMNFGGLSLTRFIDLIADQTYGKYYSITTWQYGSSALNTPEYFLSQYTPDSKWGTAENFYSSPNLNVNRVSRDKLKTTMDDGGELTASWIVNYENGTQEIGVRRLNNQGVWNNAATYNRVLPGQFTSHDFYQNNAKISGTDSLIVFSEGSSNSSTQFVLNSVLYSSAMGFTGVTPVLPPGTYIDSGEIYMANDSQTRHAQVVFKQNGRLKAVSYNNGIWGNAIELVDAANKIKRDHIITSQHGELLIAYLDQPSVPFSGMQMLKTQRFLHNGGWLASSMAVREGTEIVGLDLNNNGIAAIALLEPNATGKNLSVVHHWDMGMWSTPEIVASVNAPLELTDVNGVLIDNLNKTSISWVEKSIGGRGNESFNVLMSHHLFTGTVIDDPVRPPPITGDMIFPSNSWQQGIKVWSAPLPPGSFTSYSHFSIVANPQNSSALLAWTETGPALPVIGGPPPLSMTNVLEVNQQNVVNNQSPVPASHFGQSSRVKIGYYYETPIFVPVASWLFGNELYTSTNKFGSWSQAQFIDRNISDYELLVPQGNYVLFNPQQPANPVVNYALAWNAPNNNSAMYKANVPTEFGNSEFVDLGSHSVGGGVAASNTIIDNLGYISTAWHSDATGVSKILITNAHPLFDTNGFISTFDLNPGDPRFFHMIPLANEAIMLLGRDASSQFRAAEYHPILGFQPWVEIDTPGFVTDLYANDFATATNTRGELQVVWEEVSGGGFNVQASQVMANRFAYGVDQFDWQGVIELSNNLPGINIFPKVYIDHEGYTIVAWVNINGMEQTIYVREYLPQSGWSPVPEAVVAMNSAGGDSFSYVYLAGNDQGNVLLAWCQGNTNNQPFEEELWVMWKR